MGYTVRGKDVKFIDFTEEIKKSLMGKGLPKNPRIKLEPWQVVQLERVFGEDTHPSHKAKAILSKTLSLPIKSVQIWFQNKRAKEKLRKEKEEASHSSGDEATDSVSLSVLSERTTVLLSPRQRGSSNFEDRVEQSFSRSEEERVFRHTSPCDIFTDVSKKEGCEMSYDDCYNAISDFHLDPLDDGFCDNFLPMLSSSPITRTPAKHSSARQTPMSSPQMVSLFPPKKHLFSDLYKATTASPAKYRAELRNGSIIYHTNQEKEDFLLEISKSLENVYRYQ
ncbi:hypothetical protein NEDG_00880 [Nematocida displodere]|uniref:Homeobox domain-containing protein n=1 Tax=Nematocida displodere TaxID=1805483 RepID=A0A177ECT7_9MICR|nr:hypothetical protein NEDG_00880 [Nematocida displodere]